MSKYDNTFDVFMDQSFNNHTGNISATISSVKDSGLSKTATLFDEAVSAGLGVTQHIRDGSFNNPAMGTGVSNYMLSSGYFMNDMITFNRQELTAVYHSCWIFRKIVDIPAQDMWSRGIDISGDYDSEQLKKVYALFDKVKSEMIYATQQSRIYGGAATLMMVDDGEEDLRKPLNLKNIKKGSKINFITTDRWYGLEWSSELVDDYRSKEYGLPKYYSFFVNGTDDLEGQWIHHSRVLRFVNRRSPRIVQQMLQGWGISELEHILQDLMNHENTKNSIASLLNKALLEIIKLEGMRNTMSGLASGNPQASQMFAAQMTALNNYRSSNNLVFMDKQDVYEDHPYSFSGLSEILEKQKDIVAGAAEMPEVMLFGTNRAGLNGDSPVELRLYASTILGRQEQEIRPVLDKLLPVLFRIAGMEVPKDLTYDFEGYLDTTEETKQTALQSIVSNTQTLVDLGLITKETALEEIQAAQEQTGYGTKITERDLKLVREADKNAEENPEGAETGAEMGEGFGTGFGMDENEISNVDAVNNALQKNETQNKTISNAPPISQGPDGIVDDYADVKEQILKATIKDKKKYLK